MNNYLNQLQNSISNFQVLSLKYRSSIGVISEREIEPLALFFEQNQWKMVAYCRLRRENRTFLLSRVHELKATEKESAPNQFNLGDWFKRS